MYGVIPFHLELYISLTFVRALEKGEKPVVASFYLLSPTYLFNMSSEVLDMFHTFFFFFFSLKTIRNLMYLLLSLTS